MKLVILLFVTFCSVQSIHWQSGDNELWVWSYKCDINGTVIGSVKKSEKNCGGACLENSNCTSFVWTPSIDGGICTFKYGGVAHYEPYSTCGKVVNRTLVKILIKPNGKRTVNEFCQFYR